MLWIVKNLLNKTMNLALSCTPWLHALSHKKHLSSVASLLGSTACLGTGKCWQLQKKYYGFIEEKSLPYSLVVVPNFLDNSLLQEKHAGASTAHSFQREMGEPRPLTFQHWQWSPWRIVGTLGMKGVDKALWCSEEQQIFPAASSDGSDYQSPAYWGHLGLGCLPSLHHHQQDLCTSLGDRKSSEVKYL